MCDTYCAICGCPFVGGNLGSDAPTALRRRRAIVARKRAARERGDADPKSEDEGEREDGQDWWPEDEDRSYDPELVSEESLEWLTAGRCLGVNPQAPGESKAFISGPSVSFDDDFVEVESGDDPNQPPEDENMFCYTTSEPVFPFHQDCFDILTNVLVGSRDVAKIDKDALYDAMSELAAPEGSLFLKLDYGSISGRGRRWLAVPGEEFSVTSPATTPEVTKALEKCLADDAFELRPDSLGITREPQVQDPFSGLPSEILLNIFRFLSGDALLALLKASWPAFCATRRNAFWKWFLKLDMPWLTELGPLLDEQREGPQLSYKALYLWLDKVMAPRYGLEGPFLSLANRRRIWGVCEQLAPYYVRRLQVISLDAPDPSILERAICRHMALISDKPPLSTSWTLQKTLFVYSADEVARKATIFEAYWGEGGRLVGFSAAVGRQKQRVFGLNGAELPHLTMTATRVPASDRITAITLVIAAADPNQATTSPPAVVAILIHTPMRLPVHLESDCTRSPETPYLSRTTFKVSDWGCLVGFAGHIDQDGTIRSLGILEARLDPAGSGAVSLPASLSPPSGILPCIHRLWQPSTRSDLMWCCGTTKPPFANMFTLTAPPSKVSLIPDHLIPHEALIWALDKAGLTRMERITLYLGPGGGGTTSSSNATNTRATDRPVAVLHGLRVEYLRGNYEPKQYAGMRRNVGQDDNPSATWPQDQVVSFDVDGPGGEWIDEVAVREGFGDALGFRIKTNRGREVCVGDEGSQGWTSQRAPPGDAIIGLVAGFTGKTNVPGYGGLSSLLVLTKPI